MVACDLLLKSTFSLFQVVESLAHVIHFHLTLNSFAMFAPDVSGNGI